MSVMATAVVCGDGVVRPLVATRALPAAPDPDAASQPWPPLCTPLRWRAEQGVEGDCHVSHDESSLGFHPLWRGLPTQLQHRAPAHSLPYLCTASPSSRSPSCILPCRRSRSHPSNYGVVRPRRVTTSSSFGRPCHQHRRAHHHQSSRARPARWCRRNRSRRRRRSSRRPPPRCSPTSPSSRPSALSAIF